MTIKAVFEAAWQTIWQRKWLLVLGVVVAGALGGIDRGAVNLWYTAQEVRRFLAERFGLGSTPGGDVAGGLPDLGGVVGSEDLTRVLTAGVISLVAVLCAAGIFAIGVAVIARWAQGALIAGASQDERPFREALQMGWQRTWRLIVIASIPPIPVTLGGIISLLIVFLATMAAGLAGDPDGVLSYLRDTVWLRPVLILVNGPLLLGTIGLAMVRGLVDRACVLEDRRVWDSFRLGWAVPERHPGLFFTLLGGQVLAALAVGWILRLPRLISPIFIVLQPVNWIVGGVLVALFSAMWTVAWGEMG